MRVINALRNELIRGMASCVHLSEVVAVKQQS